MALDPITLLTTAAALLATVGALVFHASRGERGGAALRGWGLGFFVNATGLMMILSAPNAMISPVRVLGNAALMFGFGLIWAAARRFARGTAPRPTAAAAGALLWLGMVVVAAPSLGWRVGIGSAVLATYSLAAAFELTRGRFRPVDARRRGGIVLAAHGTFYALRAVLGPCFGFATWGPSLSQGWGGVLGFETMLFAVLFGAFAIAMSREHAAEAPRRDVLEDELTGVGNRRALHGSGAALLEKTTAAGRPLALLMMDLDGLQSVNDRHGPAAGDRLLVAFARLAHDYLPPTSLVCRLGGDEFVALLPGAEPDRAQAVADELCSLFAHLTLDETSGPVAATVSIGIAQGRAGHAGLTELLERAYRSLHAAKQAGRGRVVHEADVPPAEFMTAA